MWDYLSRAGVPLPPNPFEFLPEPSQVVLLLNLFSIVNAFLIVRLAGGVRIVTFPLAYTCLFLVALYANRWGAQVQFEGVTELQRIVGLTTLSQIPAALALLIAFKSQANLRA